MEPTRALRFNVARLSQLFNFALCLYNRRAMSPRRRTGRKFLATLLPIILLVALAAVGLTVWLVYGATRPPQRAYLITPEKFAHLSDRGLKSTEETWANRDGTQARGWLVRGAVDDPRRQPAGLEHEHEEDGQERRQQLSSGSTTRRHLLVL